MEQLQQCKSKFELLLFSLTNWFAQKFWPGFQSLFLEILRNSFTQSSYEYIIEFDIKKFPPGNEEKHNEDGMKTTKASNMISWLEIVT